MIRNKGTEISKFSREKNKKKENFLWRKQEVILYAKMPKLWPFHMINLTNK